MPKNAFSSMNLKVLLPDGTQRKLVDYLLPSTFFMAAALLLVASMFLPYWQMKMFAPQYPKGLSVNVYINHLDGDVREIDALNHYLGMPKLDEGGKFERSISFLAIAVLGMLLVASVFIGNQWVALLALPALAWPFIFIADLWQILYRYGHSIDPESALGSAIDPFTPPILGEGLVGQFKTIASFQPGFYLALGAGALILVGLWFHRRAYKPVMEAQKKLDDEKGL